MLCAYTVLQLIPSVIVFNARVLSRVSHVRLCDPVDCSPPGSSVHVILQARILGGLLFSAPGALPHLDIDPSSLISPALAGKFFIASTTWKAPIVFNTSYNKYFH